VPVDFESDEVRRRFDESGAGYCIVLNQEVPMSEEPWVEVARTAAKQPWWKWEEGMLYRAVSAEDPLGRKAVELRIPQYETQPLEHLRETAYPVLTDWATVGLLLELNIEARSRDQLVPINWFLVYWGSNWDPAVPGLVPIESLLEVHRD
jgi:hypothetical protein